ncbi:pentapeptide repeat-containing protein [Halohasta salina]|uniref:pentapeptide repeat-containing protein n=1 Tax=Halohasta salina TaxID=2961621 RepID=UPI0020A273D8|nr:pentapeptide repeat-containing protein [Halohasta salina]
MVALSEYEHNDVATLFVKLCEVTESKIQQRAYELTVRTPDSEPIQLIVWEGSPAVDVDWITDDWYKIEDIVIKQWETTTELDATNKTTAQRVENPIETKDVTENENTAATKEAGAVDTEPSPPQSVEPNRISELYEAFRSLRTVLDAIIEYPESAVSPSETDQPLVQYHTVIQAVIGTSKYLPAGVDGFGTQQAERVPFQMTEYREVYGTESAAYETQYPTGQNRSWITDYQTIETAPLDETTQQALEEHGLVEDASVFVRPVAPETQTPLPLLPWSSEELAQGLSLLSQFETRPSVPWDNDGVGDGDTPEKFTIQEVYEQVCTVEEIDTDHRVTIDRTNRGQLSKPTSKDIWTTDETAPTDRCGFVWPPDESADKTQRASCCYRATWRDFDRCIWHADTDIDKPIEELTDARESESNRLHNHLPREILAGAVLRDTQLTDEILTGVDFSGADFEGSEFTDVYLSYAEFTEANVSGVDFTETTVSRVSFRDADLTNATLAGLSLYNTDFNGATLADTDFTDAKIEQAIVANANIEDAVGVDTNDRPGVASTDNTEVDPSTTPAETATASGDTDSKAEDETSLVVTTDTYIDRKNMSRVVRQEDYLSALAEIAQSAIDTGSDAVVHLGNLFWTKGSRDRATDGLEELLRKLADHDIEFLLVQGPKDSAAGSTVLGTLEEENLLSILDSGWHKVGSVGLLVHGVDADSISDQTTTPPKDATATIAALYDDITTATEYSEGAGIETALEPELDLILTGTPDATNTTTELGTPLMSPGMPERLIGRSIIDSTPSTPGFLECEFLNGELNTTVHETDARPATGFRIELSADATKADVIDRLPADLPTDAAVMFEIRGEKTAESLSKREIENIVTQRVEIARGIDKRTERNSHTDTTADTDTHTTADSNIDSTDAKSTELTVESIAASSSTLEAESIETKVNKLQSYGATRKEALSCVSQYAHDEGLYSIPGVGLAIGYKLASHGVTRRDEIEPKHLDIVKEIPGITDYHIEPIIEAVDGLEKPVDATTPTTDTGPEVARNQLSEYYESFRTVRKVVSTVMQLDGTEIVPDDLTHPAVQYYVLLDACISYGLTEANFTGYGLQQRDRLPFSINDYRDAYREGSKGIIDYQEIPVESYSEDTQSWLANNTWLTDTEQFMRPVAPESGYPLPEMVTTKQELVRAVELLNEFPAYPSIPDEVDTRDRTIPIKRLYQDLFEEVHDEHLIELSRLSPPGQASGEPITGPVADATPTSEADAESMLLDYGKLSHLFRRVKPPSESPIQRQLPVFGLDWYQQRSPSFNQLQNLAKYDDDDPITHFKPRLQDMIHRRFLRDRWNYDYITVFPSHEKETLSSTLVDLAQEAVVETSVVYTPLLERTETTGRQREKSEAGRKEVAINPEETLRVRASLDGETIVLLDDICTTGSSLSAGAYLLRESGASRVVGVTLGFTPGGPVDDVSVIKKPDAFASEIIAGVE